MKDIINILPKNVANQIAAGEVVQRPASAVKELLENSIDAGAKEIKVYIQEAGKTLIQVVDDGRGMSEKDAIMCFERHATSKLKDAKVHQVITSVWIAIVDSKDGQNFEVLQKENICNRTDVYFSQ